MWTLQVTLKKKICHKPCKKYAGQEKCVFFLKQDPDPDPNPLLKLWFAGSGSGRKWTGSATLLISRFGSVRFGTVQYGGTVPVPTGTNLGKLNVCCTFIVTVLKNITAITVPTVLQMLSGWVNNRGSSYRTTFFYTGRWYGTYPDREHIDPDSGSWSIAWLDLRLKRTKYKGLKRKILGIKFSGSYDSWLPRPVGNKFVWEN